MSIDPDSLTFAAGFVCAHEQRKFASRAFSAGNDPEVMLRQLSSSLLANAAAEEASLVRSRVVKTGYSTWQKLVYAWMTGFLATGQRPNYVQKHHKDMSLVDFFNGYRLALPGETIFPAQTASYNYIVPPMTKWQIQIMEGDKNNSLYFMDDFTAYSGSSSGAYITISSAYLAEVQPWVLKNSIVDIFKKPEVTRDSQILEKAGFSAQDLQKLFWQGGEGLGLPKASNPLALSELEALRQVAVQWSDFDRMPPVSALTDEGFVYRIPDQVMKDTKLAHSICCEVLAFGREEPRAMTWGLIKRSLERHGIPLDKMPEPEQVKAGVRSPGAVKFDMAP